MLHNDNLLSHSTKQDGGLTPKEIEIAGGITSNLPYPLLKRGGEQGVVITAMAEHYNIPALKKRRQALRSNLSKSEVIMWRHLSHRQLCGYKFRRQHSVDHYVIDFYCPEIKLAIEIDGDSHFVPGAEEYDKQRQEHIETYGIWFLRFTNTEVCTNIDGVYQKILEQLEKHTNKPQSGVYVREYSGDDKKSKSRLPLSPPQTRRGLRGGEHSRKPNTITSPH